MEEDMAQTVETVAEEGLESALECFLGGWDAVDGAIPQFGEAKPRRSSMINKCEKGV